MNEAFIKFLSSMTPEDIEAATTEEKVRNTEHMLSSRCASCGITANDEIKLSKCNGCHYFAYCGIKCQKEHWPKHKLFCKARAAELRDELLFKQPESNHFGDCPICSLPIPIDPLKSNVMHCCSKYVCVGCDYANQKREFEKRLDPKCPFCRHPIPNSQAEIDRNRMKRVKANDPLALREFGYRCFFEEADYKRALECWTKATELGDVISHYQLACMYQHGNGVEKDKKKEVYHLEQAAIGGDPGARYALGCHEGGMGNNKRAVKHFTIAANLGHDESLANLKKGFKRGILSKEDFAAALRAHQAAVNATKSPQRNAVPAERRGLRN